MTDRPGKNTYDLWARLPTSGRGCRPLGAAALRGHWQSIGQSLTAEIAALAAQEWRHPVTGERVRFGHSTVERWLYQARRDRQDPVGALRRRPRQDAGRQALRTQHAEHPGWSAQLHWANLVAAAKTKPELRPAPSYATVRRFLRSVGSAVAGSDAAMSRRRPFGRRRKGKCRCGCR
jgi:hypothetical protein